MPPPAAESLLTPDSGHDLAEAGVYPDAPSAHEHGLVVLSMGLAYWMFVREGRFHLCVERERLPEVRRELRLHQERVGGRRAASGFPAFGRLDPLGPFFWSLTLTVFFLVQRWAAPGMLERGAMDAGRFLQGEYWRAFTALTLHLDSGHLLGNLAAGSLWGLFVAQSLGIGLGWSLVVLSGAAGNALAALLAPDRPGLAAGASTAVFGALGILVAVALRQRFFPAGAPPRLSRFIPLAAGLTLLTLLGAGSARSDVLGHACGFLAGLALGAVGYSAAIRGGSATRWNLVPGLAVFLMLGAAWYLAVR